MMNLDPAQTAAHIAMALLCLGLVLCFLRLIRGPSLPDRVVALDLIAILMVGLMAASTVISGETLPLRAAVVVALLAFLGTVAFARFLERRTPK